MFLWLLGTLVGNCQNTGTLQDALVGDVVLSLLWNGLLAVGLNRLVGVDGVWTVQVTLEITRLPTDLSACFVMRCQITVRSERLVVCSRLFRAIITRAAGVIESLHTFDGLLWGVSDSFLDKRTREADPEVDLCACIILELLDLDILVDLQVLGAAHR